jgi:PleD family two-component response regulator
LRIPVRTTRARSPSGFKNPHHRETWIFQERFLMPTRVLLADDHTVVRQGLRVLLERDGFSVVAEASDGHEAIKLAETNHPEVAVLDLAMPLLNGIDAAREIAKPGSRTKVFCSPCMRKIIWCWKPCAPE